MLLRTFALCVEMHASHFADENCVCNSLCTTLKKKIYIYMYIAGFFVTIWKHGRGGCRDSDVQIFLFRYLMKPVQKEHRKCLENSTSLTDTPPLSVVFNTV